jgi:hypothetical protein
LGQWVSGRLSGGCHGRLRLGRAAQAGELHGQHGVGLVGGVDDANAAVADEGLADLGGKHGGGLGVGGVGYDRGDEHALEVAFHPGAEAVVGAGAGENEDGDGEGRVDAQVMKFMSKHPRIQTKYLSLAKRLTVGDKRNRACAYAPVEATVFMMMDDDDQGTDDE